MFTVKLNGSQQFDTQISMHPLFHNYGASLAQEPQKRLYNAPRKHSILDYGKRKKCQ